MGSEIIFLATLIIAVPLVYWIILKSSAEKIATQYQLLAEHFVLTYNQPAAKMKGFIRPEPFVYGIYRGREMSISAPGKGLQNTRQIESVLKLELKSSHLSAQLTTAGALGGLRQRDSRGQARWKSGDENFDQTVDARTNHGESLATLLTEERRMWLISNLKKSNATIYIGGDNLAYAKLGLIADEATRKNFQVATEFLCNLAESIEA